MLKLGQTGSQAVLIETRPTRAALLASPLVAVLATTPLWLAPEPDAPRVVTALALALSAVVLALLGLPRRRIVDAVGSLCPDGVGTAMVLRLVRGSAEEPELYRTELGFGDGRSRIVLSGPDPGAVLDDALRLARELDVPLRAGWGLERHYGDGDLRAFFAQKRTSPAESGLKPHAAGVLELPFWAEQRRVAFTTLWAGAFVAVVTLFLMASPARSAPPAALSLVLPALSVVFPLVLGAIFLGLRRKLRVSASGVEVVPVLFGRELGEFQRLGSGLVSAFDVAPSEGRIRHLLLALEDRPVAFASEVPALFSAQPRPSVPSRPAPAEPAERERLRAI